MSAPSLAISSRMREEAAEPPRVIGLDRQGIELRRLPPGDVVGEVLRRARGRASAAQQETRPLQASLDRHLDLAAARQRGDGAGDQVEQQLHLVLGHLSGDAAPDQLVLALADQPAADLLGGAELDLGSGRPGGAEGEAGELQPRGGLLRDVADDVERVVLGLRVVVLVEDLRAVVDGADGTDHVVADLARDQRRELEIGRLGALCHHRTSVLVGV